MKFYVIVMAQLISLQKQHSYDKIQIDPIVQFMMSQWEILSLGNATYCVSPHLVTRSTICNVYNPMHRIMYNV